MNDNTLSKFFSRFESVNFAEVLQDSGVKGAQETLDAKILDCYNQCCPMKTKIISIEDQLKPRITRPIKEKVKKYIIISLHSSNF